MRRALLLAALFAAGCQAHMIETRGASPRLTGDGLVRDQKGGVIRWLANGPAFLKNGRRADAEKQMRAYCGGDFTVTAEGPRSKFGASMPIVKGGLEMDEWWYAAFDCAK